MNRRVNLTLGLVLSALICITSVGGTFASWRVSNDTVNKLSVGVVRGEINETYTDGLTYMPGATVEKIVNFTNTGTVDSVIRVKLTPAWGDTRTSDGKLVVNTALPAESVHINCSSALWLYDGADGYYYYLGVLAPGETTHAAVMNSFTISPTLGNTYAGKQGDIKVELECVQAGGGGIALWGKTLSELGIAYTPDSDTPPDVNVFFDGPESGFSFDVLQGDLFANFKELVPGESRTETLRVKNNSTEFTEITLRADFFDDDLSAEDKARAEQLLRELAVITVADSDGNTVYSGAIWDKSDGVDSMKSRISLGVYRAGIENAFSVTLTLKPEVDNAYASLLGEVKWIFEAGNASSSSDITSPTEPSVPDTTHGGDNPSVPKLGDTSVTAGFAAVALISGAVFLVLLKCSKKRDDASAS